MWQFDPWTLQVEQAVQRQQLQNMTVITATAILHIKRSSISMKINAGLKKTNTEGMWEPEF